MKILWLLLPLLPSSPSVSAGNRGLQTGIKIGTGARNIHRKKQFVVVPVREVILTKGIKFPNMNHDFLEDQIVSKSSYMRKGK